MKKEHINQILHEISKEEVPNDLDIWPVIQTRLQPQRLRKASFIPATVRLGWIGVGLLFLLLVSGIVYALNPIIHDLLVTDPGLNNVESKGLGYSLNLNQTIDKVTVILNWVYVDENRITVAYLVHTPDAEEYEPQQFTLTDDVGHNFLSIVGMGTSNTAEKTEVITSLGEDGYIFSFDAASVPNKPSTLNLQLEMSLTSRSTSQVIGPFTFNFDAPVTPGRIADPKQTVIQEDIAVTLERVIITPSDTMAIICFKTPNEAYNDWLPISQVDVETADGNFQAVVGRQANQHDTCTNNHYFPPLYEYSGSWKLTVTELVGFKDIGPEQLRIAGPWVFEFEMP